MEKGFADATTPMGCSDSDLVNPQFRIWLVGVNVVNGRCKSNHAPRIDRDHEMVPRVDEKFPGHERIDRIVEDTSRDVGEYSFVAGAQKFDLNPHSFFPSSSQARNKKRNGPASAPSRPQGPDLRPLPEMVDVSTPHGFSR